MVLSLDCDSLRDLLEERRLTLREAAGVLGVSHVQVFRVANRFGIKRREQTLRGREEEVYELFLDDCSVADIADRMDCSVRRIQQVIRAVKASEVDEDSVAKPVDVWRCPDHGLVRFDPCVMCLAQIHRNRASQM